MATKSLLKSLQKPELKNIPLSQGIKEIDVLNQNLDQNLQNQDHDQSPEIVGGGRGIGVVGGEEILQNPPEIAVTDVEVLRETEVVEIHGGILQEIEVDMIEIGKGPGQGIVDVVKC